ncbi:MAG TPA: serine hydrolase [Candidatus Krumholzibacteria bacterium]|nr:serine hydrolase [Candidatus Krumholzibacteria bacterium]
MRAVTFVFLALLALPVSALCADQMPTDLDAALTEAIADWGVPGVAIVIVKDDQVVAAKGYGVRELGKPGKVDGETIFDIASLTKSFTAAGAAVLVDAKELQWDDKVSDRLPNVKFKNECIGREVTLRDLLTHRTGLQPANSTFVFFGFDRKDILSCVQYLQPQRPFRTGMVYSNILYTVAGEMTAAVAKTTWEDLIRTRVVEPAGMKFTAVGKRPSVKNIASPHALFDGKQKPIRPYDFAMVAPSASVYTNAIDMARWLRLQLNDGLIDGTQVISKASMEEMHSPQTIIATTAEMRAARHVEFFGAYGLGWQIMDYRGEPLHWHTGNADGMPSYMALLPRKKLGVAVMMNTWGVGTFHGTLMGMILDHYLGVPLEDVSGDMLTRHKQAVEDERKEKASIVEKKAAASAPLPPLKDYAGVYIADLYGDIAVAVKDGKLAMQLGKGDKATLIHDSNDTFYVEWAEPVHREVFYNTKVTINPKDGRLEMQLNRDRVEATRVK